MKHRRFFDRPAPTQIKVPPLKIHKMDIAIPKLEYKVIAEPVLERQFTGNVTTIPTVLIFYLNPNELKMVCTILQDTMERGACVQSAYQLSIRHRISPLTANTALMHLRRMGIIYEHGTPRRRELYVDLSAVQWLDDLLEDEDRGIYRRLRRVVGFKYIFNITKEDIEKAYDNKVLPPDHDIEEEEEYD